uniref:NADH-ubiquinone oxidoreductase chain 5 n=1 Tax=Ophiothrix scotiosa TaxID=3135525 RepID=A0AAU6PX76_9ECHI
MLLNSFILLSFFIYTTFFFLAPSSNNKNYITLLGAVTIITLIFTANWALSGCPNTLVTFSWYSSTIINFSASLALDFFSLTFFSVGVFVTWSIIEFSHYYMDTDPNQSRFISTLILFLLFMLILVSANNLFLLFVGWEGVGIMSFVLISWWFTRSEANSSALQAVIYNRIGDTGIILLIILSAAHLNTWNLSQIINTSPSSILNLLSIGIIIAATGKSAQFSLHPWLPSAMEGPTPVSALLHSSTMVVAGVFLLIRTSPLLSGTNWALTITGLLGSITALFAASVALSQNDFKKIIAYSTTSQLGLMVVAVSLNFPLLALFHICTHAFFKALLFLCSGSVIHSFNNEQDLRKISTTSIVTPFTTAAITIASLALCGLPFLAGFFSKDLILEAAQVNTANLLSTVLAFIATLFTAIYTLRTIYFITYPNTNTLPLNPISEEHTNLNWALLRLLIGALSAGWAFSMSFFNFNPMLIPLHLKNIPILIIVVATVMLVSQNINANNPNITSFLGLNWFFTQITHNLLPTLTIINSLLGTLRNLDQGWTLFSSTSISNLTSRLINLIQSAFNANIIRYIIAATLFATAALVSLSAT